MRKYISNKTFAYLVGILLFILIWQLIAVAIGQRTMVFSGPFETIEYTIKLLQKEYTYRCIVSSMARMLMGYGVSLLFGFVLGVIAGNNCYVEDVLSPTIIALRAIPTASLIYLFIVLAGFKLAPAYLVFLISFPIVYEGIKDGIKNVPEEFIEASNLDGAGYFLTNFRVKLPLAIPYIISAMASSFSLCFKIEIMAEVITGSSMAGIGSAIYGVRSSDPTNMVPVFAYSLIAIVMMLLIDLLVKVITKQIVLD